MARVLILTIVILLGTIDVLAFQGVINSSINIPCNIPEGFDTEIVRWFVNVSTEPLLTYIPKDSSISPSDHDPRLSINDSGGLIISPLSKSDSGMYKCQLTTALLVEDVESVANLTVLDGCIMWAYSPPLMATSGRCSSGEVVEYAQQCGFTCQEGFRLEGNAYTECQSDGELANHRPNCEEVTCPINNISPHLTDKNNNCVEDARVRFGTICDFECPTDYNINGTGTIRITCGDGDTTVFPQCEAVSEESEPLGRGYIVLIFFFSLGIAVGICILLWLFYRRKTGINSKNDSTYDNNDSSPLITTCRGLMDLLRQQIGNNSKAIIRVLPTLQQAELKNIPMLYKMRFIENNASDKRHTVLDAFVWYVAEIVRCIDQSNTRVSAELINDILLAIEDSTSKCATKTSSVGPLEQPEGTGNKSYLDVVNSAFENLLVALRQNITDEDVMKERTTSASRTIRSYLKDKKSGTGDIGLECDEETIEMTSYRTGSSDGSKCFAKVCLQNINKCHKLNDRIIMRYKILAIMVGSSVGNQT